MMTTTTTTMMTMTTTMMMTMTMTAAAAMTAINGHDTTIRTTIRQKIMMLMLTAVDGDDASDTIYDRVQSQ